jgi:hypothetical protein
MVAARCIASVLRIAMQVRATRPTLAYARVFPWAGHAPEEGLGIPWRGGGDARAAHDVTGISGSRGGTADGLGFVGFRQLAGAGARDFGVRLLTAR